MKDDDYEDVPIEEFGLAIFRGMGWKDGTVLVLILHCVFKSQLLAYLLLVTSSLVKTLF